MDDKPTERVEIPAKFADHIEEAREKFELLVLAAAQDKRLALLPVESSVPNAPPFFVISVVDETMTHALPLGIIPTGIPMTSLLKLLDALGAQTPGVTADPEYKGVLN